MKTFKLIFWAIVMAVALLSGAGIISLGVITASDCFVIFFVATLGFLNEVNFAK